MHSTANVVRPESRPTASGCVAAADNGGLIKYTIVVPGCGPPFVAPFISYKFTESNHLCRTITPNQQWEGTVSDSLLSSSSPRNTLRRCKKADRPSQIECALCSRYPRAVKFLTIILTELKKDPGVPRLPNLKVRSAEKQRRRSVRLPYRSGSCL